MNKARATVLEWLLRRPMALERQLRRAFGCASLGLQALPPRHLSCDASRSRGARDIPVLTGRCGVQDVRPETRKRDQTSEGPLQ